MSKNVVIIGAGGHAKVIADIILTSGDNVIGFLDDSDEKQNKAIYKNYKVIGKIAEIEKYKNNYFIIAIGNNHTRAKIAEKLNVKYYTAIHPKAIISDTAKIGDGSAIMAGSVINPDTIVGKHCIINTSCSIDHDNIIGDFTHISPGVHLAGTVSIGDYTWVCTGANIINNLSITNNSTIGAGATVINDIKEKGVYIGIPARKKE